MTRRDPVADAIARAPLDTEPESPAERRAVAHARAQAKRGRVLSSADITATIARLAVKQDAVYLRETDGRWIAK